MCMRNEEEVGHKVGLPAHGHFKVFFDVHVQAPTRDYLSLWLYQETAPFESPFTTCWGYGGPILNLNPQVPKGNMPLGFAENRIIQEIEQDTFGKHLYLLPLTKV